MHPKNSTDTHVAQHPGTAGIGFFDTPIDNQGAMMFSVTGGLSTADALQTARVLSSGLGQICNHLRDSLDMGELAYCDGVKTLAFVAETVSALIWSVQKAKLPETVVEVGQ